MHGRCRNTADTGMARPQVAERVRELRNLWIQNKLMKLQTAFRFQNIIQIWIKTKNIFLLRLDRCWGKRWWLRNIASAWQLLARRCVGWGRNNALPCYLRRGPSRLRRLRYPVLDCVHYVRRGEPGQPPRNPRHRGTSYKIKILVEDFSLF